MNFNLIKQCSPGVIYYTLDYGVWYSRGGQVACSRGKLLHEEWGHGIEIFELFLSLTRKILTALIRLWFCLWLMDDHFIQSVSRFYVIAQGRIKNTAGNFFKILKCIPLIISKIHSLQLLPTVVQLWDINILYNYFSKI